MVSSPPNPGLMMRYASSYVNTIALAEDFSLAAFTTGMLKRKHNIDVGIEALMTYAEAYNKQRGSVEPVAVVQSTEFKSSLDAVKVLRQLFEFADTIRDEDFDLFERIIRNRDSNYNQVAPMPKDFTTPVLWGFKKFRENTSKKGGKFEGTFPSDVEVRESKEVVSDLSATAMF